MAGKKVNRLTVPNVYTVNGAEPVTSVNNILPVNGNVTLPIPTVPTNISAFINDAGYLTSATLDGYATQSWVRQQGYLTSIPSQYITDTELSTTLADYVTSSSLSTTLNSYATVTGLSTETSDRRDADDSLQLQINDKYDASNPDGFISGISRSDVITALGYTPYNSSNPNGYITSAALSDYVTNTDLSTTLADYAQTTDIPTVGNGTITINQGGVQKGTFTVNQSGNSTINLDAGGSSGTVDQTYDSTSANAQSGVAIEGELSTNYQSKLVSGTNIKTVNSTSLLGSGNIDTSEIFIATYSTTSYAKVLSAYNSGKTIFVNIYGAIGSLFSYDGTHFRFLICQTYSEGMGFGEVTLSTAGWDIGTIRISADTDLSNLSTTGQAIIDGKVSKSGDTMSGELDFVFPELDLTTTPSTNVYKGITLKDTNGNRIGKLEVAQRTDGSYGTMLSTKKYGGNDEYNTFNIGYNSSNQPFISVPNLNGAFHYTSYHLAEGVSVNGSTGVDYSLANYLPNDNYYYYVWVSAYGSGDATSGHTNNVTVSSSIFGGRPVCRSINRTKASTLSSGTIIVPIGTDRILNLNRSTNWYGTATLYLGGYQRIGING